ncbi:MAG: hypothetical protein H6754_02015 [Candidatus Omnitrophica bacterium]|nr:hypothetical protein [Candidatus Omnitrophota bacterium]
MMQSGDDKAPRVNSQSDTSVFLKDNGVAIYTILAMLTRIKNTVGLEAMLEYMDHYQKLIEQHNPHFRDAVKEALGIKNVEKMYRDINQNGK